MMAACRQLDADFLEVKNASEIWAMLKRADEIDARAAKSGWKPKYDCKRELDKFRDQPHLAGSSVESHLGKVNASAASMPLQGGAPGLGKRTK